MHPEKITNKLETKSSKKFHKGNEQYDTIKKTTQVIRLISGIK